MTEDLENTKLENLDQDNHYYFFPFYGSFVKPSNKKTKTRAFLLVSIRLFILFGLLMTTWKSSFDRNIMFVLLLITLLDIMLVYRTNIN